MGSNPSAEIGDVLPVNDVLQDDCRLLCERLNSTAAGRRYTFRLPSDEEWLHAFYAGGSLDDFIPTLTKVAWNASNSNGKMQPVGKLSPNPWLLFDMCGNCWEWSDVSCHIFGGSYDQPPADQKSHPGPNPMPSNHKSINITVRLAVDAH